MVVFNYSANYAKYELSRHYTMHYSGYEAVLPDNYGKKTQDLAYLMN